MDNFNVTQWTLGTDELCILMRFLPSSRLVKFRNISREWNDCAKRILRKRRDIGITIGSDVPRTLRFLKLLRRNRDIFLPISVITVENSGVDHEGILHKPIYKDVEQIFDMMLRRGKIVRRIAFNIGHRSGQIKPEFPAEIFLKIIQLCSTSLESMGIIRASLNYNLCKCKCSRTADHCESGNCPLKIKFSLNKLIKLEVGALTEPFDKFLPIILECSPNLVELSGSPHINVIPMLEESGRLEGIKTLKLECTVSHEVDIQRDFRIIQEAEMALEHFTIVRLAENQCENEGIFKEVEEILEKNYKTLKSLNLHDCSANEFSLPELPELTELNMKVNVGRDDSQFLVESLLKLRDNHKSITPKLRFIRVNSKVEYESGV